CWMNGGAAPAAPKRLSPFRGGARVRAEYDDGRHSDKPSGGQLMADEVMGPVGYLIVEFPGNKMTGEGFPLLVDLVDQGLIRIIDLAFVMKGEDGSVCAAELKDLDGDGEMSLAVFEGASSGLLNDDDIAAG